MEVSDEQRSEAKIDKEKRQNEARVSMASCKDWVVYHGMIEDEGNRGLWHAEGMTDDDIRTWGLGYCSQCPIASEYPSLTIPVFYSRQLVDIRHKLIGVPKDRADQVGKYRSHKSGLVPHPFNLDILDETEEVIVVEGEKKPIILIRYGFSDVLGIPGAAITEDLLKRAAALSSRRRFTLALDPGTGKNSKALARDLLLLGHEVFLADPFVKPDDLVRKYGGEVFRDVLRQARRARA